MPATASTAIPLAALVTSGLAVTFGLWGRRGYNHPVCRRCGFDLSGKPGDASRCSECGADLGRPRAVRIGRREKRRGVLAVALPVLLLCFGWEAWVGWHAARATDWNRHLPVWWLVR